MMKNDDDRRAEQMEMNGVTRRMSTEEYRQMTARSGIAHQLMLAEPSGTFGYGHEMADYIFAVRWGIEDNGSTESITSIVHKHLGRDQDKARAMHIRLESILHKAMKATV